MKKNNPKLNDIAIVAICDDGCHAMAVKEETRKAILNLIALSEGTIKIIETTIEGLIVEYPKDAVK